MHYLGIDPGSRQGGLAIIGKRRRVVSLCKTSLEPEEICHWLEQHDEQVCFAVLENVHAMPKQGVSSTFKFGENKGILRGLLVARRIPYLMVSPAQWKKHMGVTKDKAGTKALAAQLFPRVKVHHWNAEALLLAEYCRRTQ